MANLSDIYIKKEVIELLYKAFQQSEQKGISITISTNDESNEYGQNVSSYLSQTKEEREAGKKKFYIGNGRVFWTDGNIVKGEKKEEVETAVVVSDGTDDTLPF